MRLFIGIKLDTKAIKKIDSYMNYLYQTGVRGTYTKTNNIHLTLEFLGEVDKDKVNKLIDIINSIDISKLDYLEMDKTKMLKSIITLNVVKSDSLLEVQKDLHLKLKESGFILQERPYSPHITLVREASKNLEENIKVVSPVSKIILFESVRINNSLVYKELN